ncbi:MAG TPA: hypothetical protein VMZ91_13555 [Candidatus Paceibacterota bacterium]|nr:hypothetical protein [Candidatus Paceibacterota bacterium]
MIKEILFLLSGILCAIIFIYVRKKIIEAGKKKILGDNVPIVKTEEPFDISKLIKGLTDVKSPVSWAKTLSIFLNARVLLIIGIIVGVIYGYAYWKGKTSKPINFSINYEEEMTIDVPKGTVAWQKPSFSNRAYWLLEDGNKKTMIVRDIPSLKNALKPYGFRLKPFFTAGGSLGEKKCGGDFGLGIDFVKYYRWNTNVFITNQGGYIGIGYQITVNFDALIGVGKGYSGDNRVYLGGKWKF